MVVIRQEGGAERRFRCVCSQVEHRSKAYQQLVKHVRRTALGNSGSRAEQFAQVAHNVFVVGFVDAACAPEATEKIGLGS